MPVYHDGLYNTSRLVHVVAVENKTPTKVELAFDPHSVAEKQIPVRPLNVPVAAVQSVLGKLTTLKMENVLPSRSSVFTRAEAKKCQNL